MGAEQPSDGAKSDGNAKERAKNNNNKNKNKSNNNKNNNSNDVGKVKAPDASALLVNVKSSLANVFTSAEEGKLRRRFAALADGRNYITRKEFMLQPEVSGECLDKSVYIVCTEVVCQPFGQDVECL